MVEVEQPAETRAAGDRARRPVVVGAASRLPDELPAQALVKPFRRVVLDELLDEVA